MLVVKPRKKSKPSPIIAVTNPYDRFLERAI